MVNDSRFILIFRCQETYVDTGPYLSTVHPRRRRLTTLSGGFTGGGRSSGTGPVEGRAAGIRPLGFSSTVVSFFAIRPHPNVPRQRTLRQHGVQGGSAANPRLRDYEREHDFARVREFLIRTHLAFGTPAPNWGIERWNYARCFVAPMLGSSGTESGLRAASRNRPELHADRALLGPNPSVHLRTVCAWTRHWPSNHQLQ